MIPDTLAAAFDAAFDSAFDSAGSGPLGVAVSGGGDSVALLLMLATVARGRPLAAVTVDHGLRPESGDEAAAVEALCAARGIPHATLRWNGWDGAGNLQDRARQARRTLIGAWARANGIGAVALGHTLDDQAETFLMRLARGSGVDGLSGMAPATRAEGVLWLRPLLGRASGGPARLAGGRRRPLGRGSGQRRSALRPGAGAGGAAGAGAARARRRAAGRHRAGDGARPHGAGAGDGRSCRGGTGRRGCRRRDARSGAARARRRRSCGCGCSRRRWSGCRARSTGRGSSGSRRRSTRSSPGGSATG